MQLGDTVKVVFTDKSGEFNAVIVYFDEGWVGICEDGDMDNNIVYSVKVNDIAPVIDSSMTYIRFAKS